MIKIIATISNFGAAVNVGGGVEKTSFIIEVPTKNVPFHISNYIKSDKKWETLSLSLLDEEV